MTWRILWYLYGLLRVPLPPNAYSHPSPVFLLLKKFIFFLLVYRCFIRNPVTTPTSGLHQGMVVYFSFQKREGDSFHELETIEFDLNSQQQPRAD